MACSPAVQWAIIRKNSSFLVKGPRNTFTKEPNNLRSVNSFRYNGLVHEKVVGVVPAADNKGVTLITKNKKSSHPAANMNKVDLKRDSRRSFNVIVKSLKGRKYRKDLQTSALRRASAILKSQKAASKN